jgi:cell division protein FtsX
MVVCAAVLAGALSACAGGGSPVADETTPAAASTSPRSVAECPVVAFLETNATAEQRRATELAARSTPGVAAVRFISRDEALVRFRSYFPTMTPYPAASVLPESFELDVRPQTLVSQVEDALELVPGVDRVLQQKNCPGNTLRLRTAPAG